MRTTLDIDEDLLRAAKERARRENRTAGEVISQLLRQAMTQPTTAEQTREPDAHYGFRPLPSRGHIVTDETVSQLREDEAI